MTIRIRTAVLFTILSLLTKIDTSCYSFVIIATVDNAVVTSSRTQATSTTLLRTTQSALSSSSSSSDNMDDDNSINDVMKNGISVGFIGCGTIASSIATGLVLAHNKENDRVTKIKSMIISKRSESKSNELKEKFDNDNSSFSFDITENNQEIVNQADIIFLTVLPTQAKDVLNSLKFDPKRHILISLVVSFVLRYVTLRYYLSWSISIQGEYALVHFLYIKTLKTQTHTHTRKNTKYSQFFLLFFYISPSLRSLESNYKIPHLYTYILYFSM